MNRGKSVFLFKFAFDELNLDADQVAAMLDYGSEHAPGTVPDMTRDVMKMAEKCCSIEGGYVIYDDPRFDVEPYKVHVGGVPLAIGKTVLSQIIRSSKLAVFVCTAGHEIGNCYAREMALGNFLYSTVIDCVSTLVVERAIDKIQGHLVQTIGEKKVRITNRFSPGFCNWDMSGQKQLFSLLPPGFSNVALNHRNELLPLKSIAGIIGIGREVRINDEKCVQCTTPRCVLRKS
jgi:hypothetical protein